LWLLIVIIVVAAIAAIVLVANVATGNVAGQDHFKIGPDEVPSVKLVLGEERDVSSYNSTTSGGIQTITIVYKVAENQNYEMERYADALMYSDGFVMITDNDFTGPAGSGFMFARESVEDGYVVIARIDYDSGGYTLTLTRGTGTLTFN